MRNAMRPILGKAAIPQTPDERRLAGKAAGVLWLTGGGLVAAGLLIHGAATEHLNLAIALAAGAMAFGFVCFLLPWERAKPYWFHLPSILSLPTIALIVAATGGAHSPNRLLPIFLVGFVAYFLPGRGAIPYFVGAAALGGLPLLYDPAARETDAVLETVVAAVSYFIVGGMILIAKRQLEALRERADALSRLDPLTELANRRALIETMEGHLGGPEPGPVGLLLADLDGFKDANTLYGHPGGDHVLREVARALRGTVRAGDMVARLGGDEFAILAPGLGEPGMTGLAQRVLDAIRETDRRLNLQGFNLSASVGWALCPKDASTVDDLVSAADLCLRGAKLTGKGRSISPLDWLPDPASA
jgi:diguanylate cyclase (GGDEF)-like protein